jgi:hypothetical protein
VTFENDLITYANTDRYFTNGITFSLKAAWIGRIRLSSLMIPYRHPSSASYSLSLVQNMFTPTDTRVAPLLHNDRPYASYLYLGYSKVTSDPVRMLKLTTEIDIGYTGPRSPGAYLQTLVHGTFPTNDQPLGWETQIKTGPIVNYTIHLEKALINRDQLMLSTSAYVKTGTLYNQIGTGFRLQAGRQEPSFSSGTATRTSHWQYYFFLNARGALIGYDATLEGGIFNRNEVFTLSTNEISRWVASAETGFRITYKGTGLELAQHYLSPEYKGGLAHKWGRISLLFDL